MRRIADGRIVSGAEAQRLRLVDELGDDRLAVRRAWERAGLRGEPRTVLYEQPRPSGLLGLLEGRLPGGEALERVAPQPGISVRYEWR